MTDQDTSFAVLRGRLREWGADFRNHALEVDRDPDLVAQCLEFPAMRFLARMGIPREYAEPERIDGYRFDGVATLERAVILEELACSDAGLLLAAPGAALAGVCVGLVGDRTQQERFFGELIRQPVWTCLALTEPEHGSDAARLQTSLQQSADGAVLRGSKRFVGNGARARFAVVFARSAPGPLGITAALVDARSTGYCAEPLDSIGLRGAQISAIELDSAPVATEWVLGRHLPPSRRGHWAFTQTFNRWRPGVAAIALGIARAAVEYVLENRRDLSASEQHDVDAVQRSIDGARRLVHGAAASVDEGGGGHLASAAKLRASRLAADVTLAACRFFGPGARVEHPLLDKLVRDARGMEFLEGTGNMQKLAVFQGVLAGKVDRDDPFRAGADRAV